MDFTQEVMNTLNKLSDNLGASTALITGLTEDRKKTLENVLTKLTTLQSEVEMVSNALNIVNVLSTSIVETLTQKGLITTEELQATARKFVEQQQEQIREFQKSQGTQE